MDLLKYFRRRSPDFVIGPSDNPYLRRWWLIPHNKKFNIYLHQILRDDDDRALHDHPWDNMSLILKGGYTEFMKDRKGKTISKERRAGRVAFRRAETPHRLMVSHLPYGSTWTLFITGPKIRDWGFLCPQGWRFWKDYVDPKDEGRIGKGCAD